MKAVMREPKKIVPFFITALFFLSLVFSFLMPNFKTVFYTIYRESKKIWVTIDNIEFNVVETDNFKIYYKDASRDYMGFIGDNAEKSLYLVQKDFNYRIKNKIQIIVYPEYGEMAGKIGLSSGYSAMGVYFGGTISILDPSKWIKEKDKMEDIFAVEGPMVHEITHLIVDDITLGNVPVWFTEGVALYEEYRINKVEWAYNKKYTDFYKSSEIESKFYQLDEIKAYRQAFLAVKFIGENYGIECIKKILEQLGRGKTINQSLKSIIDLETDELFEKTCTVY